MYDTTTSKIAAGDTFSNEQRKRIETISLDIETYSDLDLSRTGVYAYSEAPSFEILLLGYSINDGPVHVVDIASGEEVPADIINALLDDNVEKWAFNASFERICLSNWIRKTYPEKLKETGGLKYINPAPWKCSMILSAYNGLPLSLESVGEILNLSEQKLKEGKDLIRFFCTPCTPTQKNGGRNRNLPSHDPSKWELFKKYNIRDVEVEREIRNILSRFPVPDNVWTEYHLDQTINDRGILIDRDFVKNAIDIDIQTKNEIKDTLQQLTGLDNPNSAVQMKKWLSEQGIQTSSLDKDHMTQLINSVPESIKEVLQLYQQISKSSTQKYSSMLDCACSDNRIRGMFQFYGANRSGRWAGRLVQLQNIPQNHIENLEAVKNCVNLADSDFFRMMYDNVSDTLSQVIRTSLIPEPGKKFIVADYSAIEARVLSFLADEKWRLVTFRKNGDIYCASASAMFHVPVEKNGINSDLRQKGKIAELALGYGGSVGALKKMGAVSLGIKENELQSLVDMWRGSNPAIVQLWRDVDRAALECVRMKTKTDTHGVYFLYKSGMMFIILPSGRRLTYVRPKIIQNRFGSDSVSFEGLSAAHKWEREESYGPKFVENIVQGISRDILAYAMQTLQSYKIVAHVHDELIIECDLTESVDTICRFMEKTPPWMLGIPLHAEGFETLFYRK